MSETGPRSIDFFWYINKAGFIIQASSNSGSQEPPEWVLFLTGMFIVLSTMFSVFKASEYIVNYYTNKSTKKKSNSLESDSENSKGDDLNQSPVTQFELDSCFSIYKKEPISVEEFEKLRTERIEDLKAELEKLEEAARLDRQIDERNARFGIYYMTPTTPNVRRVRRKRNDDDDDDDDGEYEYEYAPPPVDLRIQFRAEMEAIINAELDRIINPPKDPKLLYALYSQLRGHKNAKEGIYETAEQEGNLSSKEWNVGNNITTDDDIGSSGGDS